MEQMKLVYPTIEYKERAIEFLNEFYEYDSEINGVGGLNRYLKDSTYEDWLNKLISDMDIANMEGERVPALTYFYVRESDQKIIGMINIRLALNAFLKSEGGHIGYCVRPTERRKHYGTSLLEAGLKVCNVLNITSVLVSCDKDNLGSAGVIQNCGGQLEAEFYSDVFESVIQRYCIHLR